MVPDIVKLVVDVNSLGCCVFGWCEALGIGVEVLCSEGEVEAKEEVLYTARCSLFYYVICSSVNQQTKQAGKTVLCDFSLEDRN
jgi:hypothetical protein